MLQHDGGPLVQLLAVLLPRLQKKLRIDLLLATDVKT